MLTATQLTDEPALQEGQIWVESWSLDMQQELTVRYLPPAGYDPDGLQLLVRTADGQWRAAELHRDSSYLVFALEAGDSGFCLVQTTPDYGPYILAGCAAVAVLAVAVAVFLTVRRRKKAKENQTQNIA